MATTTMQTDVIAEERAALKQHRDLERARKRARKAQTRAWRQRLQEAVAETRKRNARCRCNFRGISSRAELIEMGAGCTAGHHVCPRLDAVRRQMGI